MHIVIRGLDKSNIRVETKNKVPQVLDWINYTEKQSIEGLLDKNKEYGLRTGTKLGNYWFCCLDIDKQGWVKICEYLSYVKTKRGIHIYCLIGGKEPRERRSQLSRIGLMTWLVVICALRNWEEQAKKALLKIEITLTFEGLGVFIRYCV